MEQKGLNWGKFVASRASVGPPLRVLSNMGKENARYMPKISGKDEIDNKSRKFGGNLTNANVAAKDKNPNKKPLRSVEAGNGIKRIEARTRDQTFGAPMPHPCSSANLIKQSSVKKSLRKPPKIAPLVKRSLQKKKLEGGNIRPTPLPCAQRRLRRNGIVEAGKARRDGSEGALAESFVVRHNSVSQNGISNLPKAESRHQRALAKHLERIKPECVNAINAKTVLHERNQFLGKKANGDPSKARKIRPSGVFQPSLGASRAGVVRGSTSIVSSPFLCRNAIADASKPIGIAQKAFSTTIVTRSELFSRDTNIEDCEEELPSIDKDDGGDPLAVSEYVDDIYDFYWYTEKCSVLPAVDYMSYQDNINPEMRALLIDWLVDVHFKFKLMPETLFLTSTIIDNFLSSEIVARRDLQLVGLTALLIAAKYEEIWPPMVSDLVAVTDNSYTRHQVLAMEKLMLKRLKFKLALPTPYVFLKRFLKAGEADKQMEDLAFYLAELCLLEYNSLQWKPSMLAASSVQLARHMLGKEPAWTRLLQKHARYEESELRGCISMIDRFQKKGRDNSKTSVYSKYSSRELGNVARLFSSTGEGV